MSNNDCVEVKMDSIIGKRVTQLRKNQDNLEDLVQTLIERLSGVMSPEAPSEVKTSASTTPPATPVSAHALDLDMLGDRSEDTNRRLSSLIARIEL